MASEGGPSVQEQLRAILNANAVRVIDLFRDWDEDESGRIDRTEFRKGLLAQVACGLVAWRRRRARERLGKARADLLRLEPERDSVAAGRRRRRRGASESRGRRRGVLLRAATPPITRRSVQRVAAAGRKSRLAVS